MADNNLSEIHTSNVPDLSQYDIDVDIDFELNDGRGAWVVVLLRKESSLPLADSGN